MSALAPTNGKDVALLTERQEQFEKRIDQLDARVEAGFAKIGREFDSLRSNFTDQRAANWPLIIGFLGIIFTIVTGGFFIIQMRIDASGSPIITTQQLIQQNARATADLLTKVADTQQQVKADLAANLAGDRASADDRVHLNTEVSRLSGAQSEGEAVRREQNAKLVEIETQFAAAAAVQNVREKHSQQLAGLVWSKLFGEDLPDGFTSFDISNRTSK